MRTCQDDTSSPASGVLLMSLQSKSHPKWRMICDARCHNSDGICSCICAGLFHHVGEGAALQQAIERSGPGLVQKWKGLGVDVSGLERELEKLQRAGVAQ